MFGAISLVLYVSSAILPLARLILRQLMHAHLKTRLCNSKRAQIAALLSKSVNEGESGMGSVELSNNCVLMRG